MADTQQRTIQIGGVKELAILVGILLTVIAGTIGTYWIRWKGVEVEAAGPGASTVAEKPAGEPARPQAAALAPTAGVFHADVYFDFKSARLRADGARVLQETAAAMDLADAWVVLVQGYADSQGPAEYNRTLAQRRAQSVKLFLVELGVPETAIKLVTMGQDGALCDDPGKECQQLNRRVHLEFRKLAASAPASPTAAAAGAGDQAQAEATSPAGDR